MKRRGFLQGALAACGLAAVVPKVLGAAVAVEPTEPEKYGPTIAAALRAIRDGRALPYSVDEVHRQMMDNNYAFAVLHTPSTDGLGPVVLAYGEFDAEGARIGKIHGWGQRRMIYAYSPDGGFGLDRSWIVPSAVMDEDIGPTYRASRL